MTINDTLTGLLFRKAKAADIDHIWEIINQAKAQMHRLGSQQWNENYPAIETILRDVKEGNGYVFCLHNKIVTYGVISFSGEEAYANIDGQWSNEMPYMIVHRLAVADEMKRQGMAKRFMLQAEDVARSKGIYSFRLDTNYDNAYMLHLIETLGFEYCGEVCYRGNQVRKAFDKSIRPLSYSFGHLGCTIREACYEDAEAIYNTIVLNRVDLRIWLPFVDNLKSVADEQAFLQSILEVPYEQRDPVYILEEGENICGLIGFHFSDRNNHRTEIGYWLTPFYRGYGIMTKAVRYLCCLAIREHGVHRIQIRCATTNLASNAIPQRLGFTYEGTERDGELLVNGKYVDIHIYSILSQEVEKWS